MSALFKLILTKPAYDYLASEYQAFRSHGSKRLAASLMVFLQSLGWIIFRFESPQWRWVELHHQELYPHIHPLKPRIGDLVRYLIQTLWLLLVYPQRQQLVAYHMQKKGSKQIQDYFAWMNAIPERLNRNRLVHRFVLKMKRLDKRIKTLIFSILIGLSAVLVILCVTQPFTPTTQFVFMIILWGTAMSIRKIPGRITVIMLVLLSVLVSARYIWWRYSQTLKWDDTVSTVFGILLIIAETYIFLVLALGFFQSIWPLHRKPVPLPDDVSLWPTIDIMIPTYNEELSVIKPGVFASLGMDWPKDKLNIYLLDDGRRPELKKFAEEVGIHYIARATNEYAKAGNINHALKLTQGELVVIFDCDHIPSHSFLQLCAGWFLKDNKLAILQTPHHFFSPDPFEKNLGSFLNTPNEGALFYGVIQDGNDTWDATYFCGSAGILRRQALEEIGGFAVHSITEDASTSIRLQRMGYTSAYIRIPLAAGLATESLAGHIRQRIRWARGMVQILRLDNPLFRKGLKWPQRLCYFNAILYFLSGVPRLIFFVTPIAYLMLHAYILYAPASLLLLYAIPHITHAVIANTRIQGKYRHFLWNEIYETVMAWYIAIPTTMALINPLKGKFDVTVKGGLVNETYADWSTARPYLVLLVLNLFGLGFGLWRVFYGPENELLAVLTTMGWVLFNLTILGGALGVDVESKQIRKSHRVEFSMPAALETSDGHVYPAMLSNYSGSGVGLKVERAGLVKQNEKVKLLLKQDDGEYEFRGKAVRLVDNNVGIELELTTTKQNVDFIQCTFARADTWALWQKNFPEDKPMQSLREVMRVDVGGYLSILEFAPSLIRTPLTGLTYFILWLVSFAPHRVKKATEVPSGIETLIQTKWMKE